MGTDDDAAAAAGVVGAYDRPPSVPRTLAIPRSTVPPPNALEIRGEVVLPRRAFDEFVWGECGFGKLGEKKPKEGTDRQCPGTGTSGQSSSG